jgi:hypothetical protein
MEETESKEKTEGAIEDSIISLFLAVDDMKICGRPFFFYQQIYIIFVVIDRKANLIRL